MLIDLSSMGGKRGVDTSDADATSEDILLNKTAYVNGQKVTGNIASKSAQTYTPTTSDQTISSGQYISGTQTIKGDSNLVSANIKSGTTIFGVSGASAVVNTSDANATATDIATGKTAYVGGAKVMGTLEKPVLSYGESFTRYRVHELNNTKSAYATASVGSYALLGGSGLDVYDEALTYSYINDSTAVTSTTVGSYAIFGLNANPPTAYDEYLTKHTLTVPDRYRNALAATTVGNHGLFGGGNTYSDVDAYDDTLTRSVPTSLSRARGNLGAASVGNYGLFGGGRENSNHSKVVDAYDELLVRSIPTELSQIRSVLSATSVDSYALFGTGNYENYSVSRTLDIYDEELTRTITSAYVCSYSYGAASIGTHAIFGGGQSGTSTAGASYTSAVASYNEILTCLACPPLSTAKASASAAAVGIHILFGGGGANGKAYKVVDDYKRDTILTYQGKTYYQRESMSGNSQW